MVPSLNVKMAVAFDASDDRKALTANLSAEDPDKVTGVDHDAELPTIMAELACAT
jgi:hypothetical protein